VHAILLAKHRNYATLILNKYYFRSEYGLMTECLQLLLHIIIK